MRKILAVDAGGTSSRAVLLDESGACTAFGRAGGGNPTAVGVAAAVDALALGIERAIDGAAPPVQDSLVLVALAGTATPPFLALLESRLDAIGLRGPIVIEPDLLGTFCSGTSLADGYAVIAGTGAIAARVVDGQIHTVKGGSGWLLGDTGSGFWIGQQVARAVVAALDGLGPPTALTPLLLEATGVERTGERNRGRSDELSQLVLELYALRPVELARFAPLAFTAIDPEVTTPGPDPVALEIVDAAAVGIGRVLSAALEPETGGMSVPGVVVLGGSVLAAGLAQAPEIFTPRLRTAAGQAAFADVSFVPVVDGVVGAAVLALRHLGVVVDEELHRRLGSEIDRVRSAADAR